MRRVFRDSSRTGLRSVIFPALVILSLAVGVFVLLAGLAWKNQERIVFQPPPAPYPGDEGAKKVAYEATDGQSLFAYVIGDPQQAAGTLLVFHGNADLAVWTLPWAREVSARTELAVIIAEYRGYAGLAGSPTYEGSALDADAAFTAARDLLAVDPALLSLYGHSLGSAVAAELAVRLAKRGVPPRALLLESPLSTAREMARVVVARPVLVLWRAISRVHYATTDRVRELRVPVSVAHGRRDFVIPARMGQAVWDAAAVKGHLLMVPRAGHNDVAEVAGEAYWQWLRAALAPAQNPSQTAGTLNDSPSR